MGFDMYETGVMNWDDAHAFMRAIDQHIGVDYEINQLDQGEYYVVVFDLETEAELSLCRKFDKGV